MSVLAEPRRKQKWSVDPRNSAWSNDESTFGQKMQERMGWAKGKGLGKSEQGATEHIRVKVKNNSLGLGTTVNNEIAHQDDFNQLLAELNNCHGRNNTDRKLNFKHEVQSTTTKKGEAVGLTQEEREEDKDTVTNPNPETQPNTVTSTLIMQEYFAQRMGQIKKTQAG
uniref:PIN2 (TERF1) interacting telomerase inhibitor 1 n=1 Tax=Sinocyclocheilus grahami TaxID=75366 RepID=A0A672NXY2_SINGR